MTRQKIKTTSSGCKKVCRKSWIELRRATWASRASMALKVFQFNRASSFQCGAETSFPDWAQKCERQTAPRQWPPPDLQFQGLENHRGRRTYQRPCCHSYAPPAHQPVTAIAEADLGFDFRSEASVEIRRAWML